MVKVLVLLFLALKGEIGKKLKRNTSCVAIKGREMATRIRVKNPLSLRIGLY